MKRVLVVTNDFPPRRGGIETFVRELCGRLDPTEVVVYTARMDGDAAYDATLPFPVHRDPRGTLLPTPAVARRLSRVLAAEQCDVVVFGAAAPLGLLAPAVRRAGARRVVALTHGHEVWWTRVPVARQALRRIGESVDVLTYVSGWCRDRIAPALGAAGRSRLTALSPGVDPERFRPDCGGAEVRERLGLPADVPVVVCTARMVRRKGQDTLVRAWPAVRRAVPGAVLLLVGDGPVRESVTRLAADHGVAEAVLAVGSVPAAEMPGWTDAGDVFAMPCRTRRLGLEPEAFGIVFLEAAACGLPVVGGDSGGAPEAVGEYGSVVDGRDVGAVAAAVVEALRRRRPRAADGRAVAAPGQHATVAQEHSWATVGERFRALLAG